MSARGLQCWRRVASWRSLQHFAFGTSDWTKPACFCTNAATRSVTGTDEKEVKTLSRWQKLKIARREAPPPKQRSNYQFDRKTLYSVADALQHVRASKWADFDETLEVVFRLNLDPRHAEQNIRGTAELPHGSGVPVKVAVFAFPGQMANEALKAGADLVGADDLIEQVATSKGKNLSGFAACVATPEIIPKMASSVGKILGPKGLMPNKKTGSVTGDPGEAVSKLKKGQVSFRVDRYGSVASRVGKLSFTDNQLTENLLSITRAVLAARPETVKKKYMLSVHTSSSMGPSAKLDPLLLSKLALDPSQLPPVGER